MRAERALGMFSTVFIALTAIWETEAADPTPCLDSTSTWYRCSYDGSTTALDLSFDSAYCEIDDDQLDYVSDCLDDFGRANIVEKMSLNYQTHITYLPRDIFSGLTNLDWMVLYGQSLTEIPREVFNGLSNMTQLAISFTDLETLPKGLFDDLPLLESLDLYGNKIYSLAEGLFERLVILKKLWLADNELTTLNEAIFTDMVSLEELYLYYNDLQCLPASSATTIQLDSEDIRNGTCECDQPVDGPPLCADGITCISGDEGYLCRFLW